MSGPPSRITAPAGTWTKVSWGPIPFVTTALFWLNPPVPLQWRRYTDAPPFYLEGVFPGTTGGYAYDVERRAYRLGIFVPGPALFNEWWFNPTATATFNND